MLAIVLAACMVLQTETAKQTPTSLPLAEGARIRYGNFLMREAFLAVSPPDISIAELDAAIFMSRKAALLQPDDPDRWRVVLGLALLSGDMSTYAVEVAQEAIARLVKLCPDDQVLRLQRLLQDIERRETAEERVQAFKKYLTPDAIKAIGAPVASRLALDCALLESRRGELDAFAQYLEQALTLSAAFPAAATTAAGFINEKIDDPVAECELLVAASLADPLDVRSWTRLAALLLQEGAYGSAARIDQITLSALRLQVDSAIANEMVVSDQALALWGSNRPADAVKVIERFVAQAIEQNVRTIQERNPYFTREQCQAVPYPLSQLVAMMDATIRFDMKDPGADAAIKKLVSAARDAAEITDPIGGAAKKTESAEDPQERLVNATIAAQNLLDAAVAVAMLNGEATAVNDLLDRANKRLPISDAVKTRFKAWEKCKGGDAAGALAIMTKEDAAQPAGKMLRAQALMASGDRKSAATLYFEVMRDAPGTLIGLFARSQLKVILGVDIPPGAVVGKLDGIIASIPSAIERYLAGLDVPVSLQFQPLKDSVDPFEPIVYRLTMTNRSVLPLAITSSGPIRHQVILVPRISSKILGVDRLQPQIVPVDRAIELAPGQSITLLWDVAWTEVGLRLAQDPLGGGILDTRAVSNFIVLPQSVSAGAFGADIGAKSVYINGVRVDANWITAAIASARAPANDGDLVALVLLAFAARDKKLDAELESTAWKAIAEGFATLPPEAQAWVLLVAPRQSDGFNPVLDIARATANDDVRAAYLLSYCVQSDDGQLDAALRSGQEFSVHANKVMRARFQRETVRADERMTGQSKGAQAGALERMKAKQDARQNAPPAKP